MLLSRAETQLSQQAQSQVVKLIFFAYPDFSLQYSDLEVTQIQLISLFKSKYSAVRAGLS